MLILPGKAKYLLHQYSFVVKISTSAVLVVNSQPFKKYVVSKTVWICKCLVKKEMN